MNRSLLIVAAAMAMSCSSDSSPSSTPQNAYADTGVDVDLGLPDASETRRQVSAERLFPTDSAPGRAFDDCMFASPIAYEGRDGTEVIVAAGETLAALDPESGAELWSVTLPAPEGERAFILGTPGRFDGGRFAVAAYHTTERNDEPNDGAKSRIRHLVSVIDLQERKVAEDYPLLELGGPFAAFGGGVVSFPATNALGRAKVVLAGESEASRGYAYVTFGNARDIQPWHGFAFEIDLDAWASASPAISGRLVTTPETDCGQSGVSGSRERLCGGGLWAPSGPLVVPREDGFELILAPGNGQLDLAREDYANTLMRLDGPGLQFEPSCDMDSCSDFDADAPSEACVESCQNLFIPRRLAEDGPLRPETGVCDGLELFECWQKLDYIGGSTPVHLELASGTRVLAYPTKDGAVYLVDADHLGTMYDREQIVAVCGTADENCRWDWAGMIVTQPAVTTHAGEPLIIVPTFMPDNAHPAGVVALRITETSGAPRLEVVWQTPNFSSESAIARFREHPSRPAIQTLASGREVVWVVEALRAQPSGRLVGMDSWDGEIVEDIAAAGPGSRFTLPLVVDDRVYFPSCGVDRDSAFVEGYRITESEN